MIRLTYFGVRGRVEPIRMMLEMAKIPYQFTAVKLESWKEDKAQFAEKSVFCQLPVLEELNEQGEPSGFTMFQSLAISRHVARLTKMDGGDDPHARARVDEVCETAQELLLEIGLQYWSPQFLETREEQREKFKGKLDTVSTYFSRVSTSPHHWVGDSFTMADCYMALFLEQMPCSFPDLFTPSSYPALHGFYSNFFMNSAVREYVTSERRPKTYTVPMAFFGNSEEASVQWT